MVNQTPGGLKTDLIYDRHDSKRKKCVKSGVQNYNRQNPANKNRKTKRHSAASAVSAKQRRGNSGRPYGNNVRRQQKPVRTNTVNKAYEAYEEFKTAGEWQQPPVEEQYAEELHEEAAGFIEQTEYNAETVMPSVEQSLPSEEQQPAAETEQNTEGFVKLITWEPQEKALPEPESVRVRKEQIRKRVSKRSLRKRRQKAKIFIVAAVCLACLIFIGAGAGYVYYRLPYRCVKTAVTIEAGDKCPSVTDFLEWDVKGAYIVSGIDEKTEFNHVRDYDVVIHLYNRDVATVLHVEDTVPPSLSTQNKTIMLGDRFSAEDFVRMFFDVTECEISYKEEPSINKGGDYVIKLQIKDEGGNITDASAKLTVLQDVTPPVISGVKELTIKVGESVSYKKGITVTDDFDTSVSIQVDNSEVDLSTPGEYTVIYSATDKAGNTTTVSTVLRVEKKEEGVVGGKVITEDEVNAAADKVLASILNPSMSQYEIIEAIYKWCNGKIAYANGTPKDSWVQGAYCGIVQRKGDCYAYAMSSKCLLTRAGIVNMDIERIRVGNGMHFWNLVDIGEGWHHFDTCRRGDGAKFFYLTDAQLMAYSNTHRAPDYPDGSHNYDRTKYPVIP